MPSAGLLARVSHPGRPGPPSPRPASVIPVNEQVWDEGVDASDARETGRMELDAIGTRWVIDTPAPLPLSVEARVTAAINDFDHDWSRFRPDSLVSEIAREGGALPVGKDGEAMMRLYSRLFTATDGAVIPLVGATLEHLGYDRAYRLTPAPGAPAPVPGWEGRFQGTTALLTLPRGTVLDVGAVGKGRLVDIVHGILDRAGIPSSTVDAGGDLRHSGPGPLRVALEHPFDPARAVGVVTFSDAALAASATNRRSWADGIHHVIDARTGSPVRDLPATWAVARTAMLADAASTAAFFLEPEQVLAALDGVYAVVVMPSSGPLRHAGLDDEHLSAELFG